MKRQRGKFDREEWSMDRRDFLRTAGIVSASFAFPNSGCLVAQSTKPGNWRTFEVTTRVEVLKPSGATRIWVPAALIRETPYQKTLVNTFKSEGGALAFINKRRSSQIPADAKITYQEYDWGLNEAK